MMKAISILMILLIPAWSFGAEAVKLKHVASAYADEAGVGIKQPEGVDCNDQAGFIVADTGNGRLVPYRLQEGAVKAGKEIKIPELSYPLTVKMTSKGAMIVLDGVKRRLLRVNPDGSFKGYLDPAGLPSSGAVVPKSFAIDQEDNVYVLDIFSERVLVLGPEGGFQRQIGFPADYGFIADIAVDRRGTVFLVDSVRATVYSAAKDAAQFAPFTRSLKEYMDFPTAIAVDPQGRVFLTDRNGSGIVVIGRDGAFQERLLSKGWPEGFLNYPSQICVNEKGDVFIADRNNSRVQIFTMLK